MSAAIPVPLKKSTAMIQRLQAPKSKISYYEPLKDSRSISASPMDRSKLSGHSHASNNGERQPRFEIEIKKSKRKSTNGRLHKGNANNLFVQRVSSQLRGNESDFQCGSLDSVSDDEEEVKFQEEDVPAKCRASMMRQQSIRDKKGSRKRPMMPSQNERAEINVTRVEPQTKSMATINRTYTGRVMIQTQPKEALCKP